MSWLDNATREELIARIVELEQKVAEMNKGTIFIYGLVDPRNGLIRYIGQTNNLEERFKQHIRGAYQHYHETMANDWIRELFKLNLMPMIVILEEVPFHNKNEKEKFWIGLFSEMVLNLAHNNKCINGHDTTLKNAKYNGGKCRICACNEKREKAGRPLISSLDEINERLPLNERSECNNGHPINDKTLVFEYNEYGAQIHNSRFGSYKCRVCSYNHGSRRKRRLPDLSYDEWLNK